MNAQKIPVFGKAFAQAVHAAGGFEHGAVRLVQQQGTADDLAVFQLVQFNACDAGFAAQDQADAALAREGGNDRIHQPEKSSPARSA